MSNNSFSHISGPIIVHGVELQSGHKGWRARLRDNYGGSKQNFQAVSETYGVLDRMDGFDTVDEAWEANPVIEGGTNPSDFRVVPEDEIEADQRAMLGVST